jgi:hypothetical protein
MAARRGSRFKVGWGVSEALAAFVATLARCTGTMMTGRCVSIAADYRLYLGQQFSGHLQIDSKEHLHLSLLR